MPEVGYGKGCRGLMANVLIFSGLNIPSGDYLRTFRDLQFQNCRINTGLINGGLDLCSQFLCGFYPTFQRVLYPVY